MTAAALGPGLRLRVAVPLPVPLLLLVAAVLIRLPALGDRASFIDDQFYLLVGDRLLHGQLPYVDVWDRKPIGLFLIYAGCRLLGGDGFVQYQLVAALFAGGTACCIDALVRPVAGRQGGFLAGLMYLAWLVVPEGGGGQAPVFYNLLTAAAALLILPAHDDGHDRGRRFGGMALVGLAMQVKYTVAVEGMLLGAVAAWRCRSPRAPLRWLGEVALLAGTALAPTGLVLAGYAAIGEAHDFWFANFTSISLRGASDPAALRGRLGEAALTLLPLATCAALGAWRLVTRGRVAERRWLLLRSGWLAAALAGYLALGVLYVHYLLPVLLPLAVLAGAVVAVRPLGPVLALLVAAIPITKGASAAFATAEQSRDTLAAFAALVPPEVSSQCMQMFAGPPALYLMTRACTPGRYVFPDHLALAIERRAIGTDPVRETQRLLATRPLVVTLRHRPLAEDNRAVWRAVAAALRPGYRRVGSVSFAGTPVDVYVRAGVTCRGCRAWSGARPSAP